MSEELERLRKEVAELKEQNRKLLDALAEAVRRTGYVAPWWPSWWYCPLPVWTAPCPRPSNQPYTITYGQSAATGSTGYSRPCSSGFSGFQSISSSSS